MTTEERIALLETQVATLQSQQVNNLTVRAATSITDKVGNKYVALNNRVAAIEAAIERMKADIADLRARVTALEA